MAKKNVTKKLFIEDLERRRSTSSLFVTTQATAEGGASSKGRMPESGGNGGFKKPSESVGGSPEPFEETNPWPKAKYSPPEPGPIELKYAPPNPGPMPKYAPPLKYAPPGPILKYAPPGPQPLYSAPEPPVKYAPPGPILKYAPPPLKYAPPQPGPIYTSAMVGEEGNPAK